RREEARGQARRVLEAIRGSGALRASEDPLSEDVLRRAYQVLEQAFDPEWGGFGRAPKFPQPMTVEFLLRCHARGYPGALDMVRLTLDRMAGGGVYDQVGGGFHRYAVDGRWHVPHFEKMLYDNAQLARLYARAWLLTGEPRYRRVAEETLDYLLREMRHPGGGFFSSQDADSEGVEGRFFVWSHDELVEVGGEAVAAYFGAVPGGNWEGTNVLWTPLPLELVAAETGVEEDDLRGRVEEARAELLARRERRVRPGTDDKVLAAWNGLAISAFAEAGRAFGEARYVEAAVDAAGFVLSELRDERGLLRSWREGKAGGPGFLDDHAIMAEACLTLYETTFDLRWFREAGALAEQVVERFHDDAAGGFYQTAADAEALITRPKELFDNAVPSGNSVAAEVLQRLALFTGDPDTERFGVSALRLVRDLLVRAPSGLGHALSALDLYLSPVREVAIVGDPSADDTRRLVGEVWERYLPNRVLAVGAPGDDEAAATVPLLAGRPSVDGRATAYVCERFVCRQPVTEPEALAAQLTGGG
ncbi:MAG: thioredoxin domain-containing protein, partial [Actinobacteria bacterium]|nr:thioredoxin domain-containing protein [Actinomycetota bacterium]